MTFFLTNICKSVHAAPRKPGFPGNGALEDDEKIFEFHSHGALGKFPFPFGLKGEFINSIKHKKLAT